MVTQYPHIVKVIQTESNNRNAKGDYQPSTTSAFATACRWEVAPRSAFVQGEDGQQIAYAGVIYLGPGKEVFPYGARVSVWQGERKLAEGKLLQFSGGQLNRRIWL